MTGVSVNLRLARNLLKVLRDELIHHPADRHNMALDLEAAIRDAEGPVSQRHVCPGYANTGCVDLDCDRRDREKYPGRWQPGMTIHGFANGVFGRDSYTCRVVETVGRDWLVTRNTDGVPEFVAADAADWIADPDDRSFCTPDCGES